MFERYWVTVYQVVVTVTTVGYGDIEIAFVNGAEMSFLCLLMIVSSVLYAYLFFLYSRCHQFTPIHTIRYAFMLAVIHSSLVSRMTQGGAQTLEHMTVWARTKGVCELQANRISDLIKFQHAVDQDTQDVMNAVSPVVRRYFQSRALMSVLLQNDTFVSLSESLLRDLCQEMRLTAAVKGTVLVSEGDFDSDIYFVDRGMCIACLENEMQNEEENDSKEKEDAKGNDSVNKKITTLYEYGPGMLYGMATCLISELRSPISLRAQEHSILYVMSSKNIRKMMMDSYMEDFNMLKRISVSKEIVPVYEKIIKAQRASRVHDANEMISIVLQMSLDEDMTKYKINLFRDEEVVISGQHLCKQSVQVGPFRRTSKSELRFVLNSCMVGTTRISDLLSQHDDSSGMNEITLELMKKNESSSNTKKKKKKSNAVFPSSSSPPSSIRIKYIIRSRNLRQRQRGEILRDIKHVIRKYVGDDDDDKKKDQEDTLW
eukprot:g4195.t1